MIPRAHLPRSFGGISKPLFQMCHLLEKRTTSSGNFTTANWDDVFVFIILRRSAIAAGFDALRDLNRSRKPKLRPEQLLIPVRQSLHLADKYR